MAQILLIFFSSEPNWSNIKYRNIVEIQKTVKRSQSFVEIQKTVKRHYFTRLFYSMMIRKIFSFLSSAPVCHAVTSLPVSCAVRTFCSGDDSPKRNAALTEYRVCSPASWRLLPACTNGPGVIKSFPFTSFFTLLLFSVLWKKNEKKKWSQLAVSFSWLYTIKKS